MHRLLLALLTFLAWPAAALDCGGKETPCKIAEGEYNIAVPEGWQGGPAVLYLHGFGGSGAKVIGNTGFVNRFLARGYAVIAPSGLRRGGEGTPRDWSVRDGLSYPRDDVVFLQAVLSDAAAHAGIDRSRVLIGGFSRGGSMVWEVACLAPETATAYAPVSGGFWLPMTEECAGPVNLLHTHGFSDTVVPLEGRRIVHGDVDITQGDIWEGLQLWRREMGCRSNAADHEIADGLWRKRWACENGSLDLVLHKGGHGLPKGWTALALDWFEALP